MLDVLRRLGAFVAASVILTLGAQACMSTLEQPSIPDSPAAVIVIAAASPSPSPISPTATPLPPTQEPPAGPAYSSLDRQLAAGWTPEARDLTIGLQLYRPLGDRAGDSCRVRVVTGQTADGQIQTADVWVDCDAMELEL